MSQRELSTVVTLLSTIAILVKQGETGICTLHAGISRDV